MNTDARHFATLAHQVHHRRAAEPEQPAPLLRPQAIERARQLRREQHRSLLEIAAEMHLTVPTVRDLLRGKP